MAKGYWIAHVDITDPQTYQNYIAANAGPIGARGERALTIPVSLRAGHLLAFQTAVLSGRNVWISTPGLGLSR